MLSSSCAAPLAVGARRLQLRLALLERDAGALELALLGGDLVADVGDPLDGRLRLVAEVADAGDDARVLVLDPLQVLVSLQDVVEAVGLEHDRERVGLAGLVDRDEPLAQHLDRVLEPLALDPQVLLLGLEPGLASSSSASTSASRLRSTATWPVSSSMRSS